MADQPFVTVDQFNGYRAKTNITNIKESGVLVSGSKNVISTDGDTVAIRKGTTLFGQASTTSDPIISSAEWASHRGVEHALRSWDDELEWYDAANNTWVRLKDGFSAVDFITAEFWDAVETQDALLLVNGTSNIYYWSGGSTTYASATTTTLTKQGSEAWGEVGFSLDGVNTVHITVVDYTALSGATVEVNLDGTKKTVTEGADWTAATSNDATATSLASAINGISGVTGAATAAEVTITGSSNNIWNVILSDETNMTSEDNEVKVVYVDGTRYFYSSGEDTATLTGVSPDPTAGGHTAGDVALQGVRTIQNSSITDLPDAFNNDIISVLDNQLYVGDNTRRDIYISQINSFTDFSFSSPRTVGQGALLTLDSAPKAFVPDDDGVMQISAGEDYWYRTVLTLSDDLTNEALSVRRLKTNPGQGAVSQDAVGSLKNLVAFISHEPTLDSLGRIENIDTPQATAISDPIKTDFDSYDTTNAHIKYWRNNLYIALPAESKVLMYNVRRGYWEAPQILPVRRLAIVDGELYGHSNSVNETYKLFTGQSDIQGASGEELPIEAVARFKYENWGSRIKKKTHNEWYSEGLIAPGTTLTRTVYLDYLGSSGEKSKDITGDTTQNTIFGSVSASSALGVAPLGTLPLGGTTTTEEDLNKFRVIHEEALQDYFEVQVEYRSYDVNQNWEIIAYGCNAAMANNVSPEIKQ